MMHLFSMIGQLARVCGISAAVTLVFGCSSIAERVIEKPKVNLKSVHLRETTPVGATIVFGVQVDNPNSFAIRVDRLLYEIEIGGKPLSSGKITESMEVAGKAKSVVELPVKVRYVDLFSSLVEFIGSGASSYRVKGQAQFGVLTVPFDKTGELELRR